jgi:hypothetical protein
MRKQKKPTAKRLEKTQDRACDLAAILRLAEGALQPEKQKCNARSEKQEVHPWDIARNRARSEKAAGLKPFSWIYSAAT